MLPSTFAIWTGPTFRSTLATRPTRLRAHSADALKQARTCKRTRARTQPRHAAQAFSAKAGIRLFVRSFVCLFVCSFICLFVARRLLIAHHKSVCLPACWFVCVLLGTRLCGMYGSWTPLFHAVRLGHRLVCNLLIQRNASVHAVGAHRRTAPVARRRQYSRAGLAAGDPLWVKYSARSDLAVRTWLCGVPRYEQRALWQR
jgi:hypothetical protein